MEAIPVNGGTVIRGQRDIFRTTPVLLAVVPVLVSARAAPSLGLAEWAAELLAGRPLSVVFPSLCMASAASQRRLPAGIFCGSFVPHLFKGMTASPSKAVVKGKCKKKQVARNIPATRSSFSLFSTLQVNSTNQLSNTKRTFVKGDFTQKMKSPHKLEIIFL